MSLAKRLAAESPSRSSYSTGRVNRGARVAKQSNARSLDLQVAELNKILERIPGLVQQAVFGKGLRPAAQVIKKRVIELTPRSDQTGSTKKWSQSTKAKRAGQLPLWKTVRLKLWRGSGGSGLGMVGYEWPTGNKGHFVIESRSDRRKKVLWGKVTDEQIKKVDVLKRAFDERKEAAAQAFAAAVAKEVDKKLAELVRG